MKDPVKYHSEGYNCAESIVKAFNNEKGLNVPTSAASSFGAGMTVGSTCGAITGALIALGGLKGRDELTVRNETAKYAKHIMKKLKEKYGTYECLELKKKGVSCDEIIEHTYEILKDTVK